MELVVVVPAHNEAGVIESVVGDVVAVVEELVAERGRVIVVDDASTDATGPLLDRLAHRFDSLSVVHLADNVGHGPALRRGFELADAVWIGHVDSDGEISAHELAALWQRRDDGDLILGVRRGRADSRDRRFVTASLRLVMRLLSGRRIADANTPCKLVRSDLLREMLRASPPDAFAPSVLLALVAARRGARIVEVPVDAHPRAHGASWLVPTRLARGCARSVRDAVAVAWSLR
jgi:glycosyltransferase involved in cell wall biosynthesis